MFQNVFLAIQTGVGYHSLLQGIFPDLGIELRSPALQADYLPFEPSGKSNIQNHDRLCQQQPHQNNIGQETLCLPGSRGVPSSMGVVLAAGHTRAASCSCRYWPCPQVKGESRCEPPWLKSPVLQGRHPFSEQPHRHNLQCFHNTYPLLQESYVMSHFKLWLLARCLWVCSVTIRNRFDHKQRVSGSVVLGSLWPHGL